MKNWDLPEVIQKFIKKKDNLIILVLTGILLLVIAWPVSGTENESKSVSGLWDSGSGNMNKKDTLEMKTDENINTCVIDENSGQKQAEYLEDKLESILQDIHGVGRVRVMITLVDYGEKVIEKDIPLERNNVIENDSGGGNRNTNEMNTNEATVYITNKDGEKIPYVIKEKSPLIEGVTVVAEGGGNATVQKNIGDVIQALFGIDAHKIIVVKMKQEE